MMIEKQSIDDKWAIVTGGGTGIGRELTRQLVNIGYQVLISGRRIEPLIETQLLVGDRVHYCQADLATEQGRAQLINHIPENADIQYIIQHAASLHPIAEVGDIALQDWRDAMAINVEAPLFLLQSLLPRLDGCRVLHISSNQAHRAQARMTAYCASKAALFSIYRNLNEELNANGIYVGSMQPGIVHTESFHSVWSKKIPDQMHRIGEVIQETYGHKLFQPEEVATYIVKLLMDVEDASFAEKEWDIRLHIL